MRLYKVIVNSLREERSLLGRLFVEAFVSSLYRVFSPPNLTKKFKASHQRGQCKQFHRSGDLLLLQVHFHAPDLSSRCHVRYVTLKYCPNTFSAYSVA